MSIFKNEKDPLLKRAKELGLNLDRNMSIFDMKSEIAKKEKELNAEWSQDAQDELQDFIESQGIYIRQ